MSSGNKNLFNGPQIHVNPRQLATEMYHAHHAISARKFETSFKNSQKISYLTERQKLY